MSRWRIITVAVLIGGPFAVLALLGSYYLWSIGWTYRVWWPLTFCMIAGYLLGWYWQRRQRLLKPIEFERPLHWTERDFQAWKVVEARARAAAGVDPERLTDLQFYVDTGRELALDLARFYHPRVQDPIGALTIPEMLAVVELASQDLAELADQYLPGGHLLTINNWRQARQATQLYQSLSKLYWMVSAVFSPVNTALRFTAAQLGMAMPWQQLQQDVVLWFFTVYVHRLGTYLIDLNSGRLRVGARRYRELVKAETPSQILAPPAGEVRPLEDPAAAIRRLTLLVFGQVKAGKSSFINALLGEQLAKTDVLPATEEVQRYDLQPAGIPTRLVLLDTVGYGHTGPREDQLRATEEAARHADLLILVMHVQNPARQADLDMLTKLRAWFAMHPELRMPPVLGVLTHIDLLSPSLEWSPPYNWQEPGRAKERSMHNAWSAVREQLGEQLAGLVPVCTAEGKVYGIEEWFLPALTSLLDEAHAVALLRCLRAEADVGKVRKVFQQLVAAGQQAALAVWEKYRKSETRTPGPTRA
jgi:predicted GTPase